MRPLPERRKLELPAAARREALGELQDLAEDARSSLGIHATAGRRELQLQAGRRGKAGERVRSGNALTALISIHDRPWHPRATRELCLREPAALTNLGEQLLSDGRRPHMQMLAYSRTRRSRLERRQAHRFDARLVRPEGRARRGGGTHQCTMTGRSQPRAYPTPDPESRGRPKDGPEADDAP